MIIRLLRQQPLVFDWAKKVSRRLGRHSPVYRELSSLDRFRQPLTFVQAGANDGISNDPIREFATRFHWRGVVAEPMPHLFKTLERNYRPYSHIHPVQCAVSCFGEPTMPLYHVKRSLIGRYPWWADQVASFSRQHVLNHFSGMTENETEATCVPSFSVEELVTRFSMDTCDFLILDVEGLEAQVLSRVDLEGLRTKSVLFERILLSDSDLSATRRRLEERGFRCKEMGHDILAVKP